MKLNLFNLIINLIESSLIYFFVLNYLEPNEKYKKWIFLPSIILMTIFISVMNIFLVYEGMYIFIEICILIVFSILYTNKSIYEKLLACLIPFVLISMINNIFLMVIIFIVEYFNLNFDFIEIINGDFFWIIIILSKIIFALSATFIVNKRKKYDCELDKNEAIGLFSIIFIFSIIYILIEYIFYDYNNSSFNMLIIVILLPIVIIITLSFFIDMLNEKNKYLKVELENQMLASEIRRSEDIIKTNNDIITIRHNIQHILSSIGMNIQDKNYDDALNIINKYENGINNIKRYNITNCGILDYHINLLSNKLYDKGIELKCDLNLVNLPNIEDDEFSVILGNIFDNAVEYCESNEKHINIIVDSINNFFRITVINTVDITSESYKSIKKFKTKKNIQYHGIGLKTIENIVKVHDGIISYGIVDGLFKISILLPEK